MKKITTLFVMMLALLLSSTVIFAQDAATIKAEKYAQKMLEQHGPTVVVPNATPGSSRAVGDDCITPIVVNTTDLPYSDLGQTTCGRGNTYSATDLGSYDGGEDIIYELVLTGPEDLTFTLTTTDTWTGMGLFDACPDVAGPAIIKSTGWSGDKSFSASLSAGTYYLMIDTWPSPGCITSFDLTIAPPAPGEACATAFNYGNVNDPAVNSATTAAYDAEWYEFTGTQDMAVTVSLCGSDYDTKLEVWNDCGDVTYAYINDDACGLQSEITGISFTAGDVMYVKVYGFGTAYGDFTLDITGIPDPGDIQGNVVDMYAAPLVGATVEVEAQGASTTTDASGDYLLTGIANGMQEVKISKPGYLTQTFMVDVIAYGMVTQDAMLPDAPPVLVELPATTDLGDWPIGAWEESILTQAINVGGGGATITSLDLDDPSGFFTFTAPDLPVTLLTGETLDIEVSFNATLGSSPGVYNAVLVATYEGAVRDVAATDLVVNAYDYFPGDVFEDPLTHVLAISPPVGNGSREFSGYYTNYNIPNPSLNPLALHDIVVEITVEDDALVDMYFSGTIPPNTNMALYAGDFGGAPGPMADNALAQDYAGIYGFQMFEGTYYLVMSGDDWLSWTIDPVYMTAPAGVTYVAPIDGAVDIEDGDDLEWTYNDAQVEEYQVILGTTYPPVDVALDWTTAGVSGDTYELTGLEANLQYFWQINVRNNVDETMGDVWGFTTTISTPQDVVATSEELFEGEFTELSWTSPLEAPRALLGYNVYREGSMINTSLVTGSTYTDDDVLLYNMAPGYEYWVTSVFDEGESDPSASVFVEFSGEETLSGTVTDDVTGLPIEGATVDMDGKDEYSNNVSYSTTTNASGFYTAEVKVGVYDITVSASGYNDGLAEDVAVVFGTPQTEDFALIEIAYPVASVTAVELSDDEVEITWVEDASRELLGYTVYRVPVLNEPGSMIPVLTVGNTTGGILIDEDWGTAVPGVYKWAVEANYSLGNNSVWVYSNTLDKDMETVVNVEVTTEFGDDPVATVTFTNTSEPALLLEYTETLDATGEFTFDPFRKGTYDVTVELDGYDPVSLTGEDIWEETDYAWLLDGAAAPPENLTVENDSLYMGEDAKLSWDVPASSEFHGYIVYRDGVALFDIPIAETSYTDVAPPYNMDVDGYVYTVTAVYLTVGESDPSNAVSVWVTGKGSVDGYVYDGRTDDPIEGALVKLLGFDEFGMEQFYSFTTDEDGYYEDEDGVWAGDYDYTVSALGYDEAMDMDVVAYDENTALDFVLFPSMDVTATEQDDDNVLIEWSFDMDETRELIDFTIYRTLWNVNLPMAWTELGATTGSSFIDSDWGTVASGVYKWVVEANYDDGSTVAFSNYLDKDMETVVNVEVVLNTAESPEGTEVTITNISEPYLDLEYALTMDASGMATIDPFRKGTYEVEVSLFGFATIFDLVVVDDTTDLYYVLEEQITAVGNLYVNPNGYATWDMPTPGGLDMFFADFEGGIPAAITIVNDGDPQGIWKLSNYSYTGGGDCAYSFWSPSCCPTDTRMNTPKVALDDNTIVEFVWYSFYYQPTTFTMEISLNEGLTWTEIWAMPTESFASGWYITTIDLADLGYTDGDVMFSAHKTDTDGASVKLDDWYIGPAAPDASSGTVAISTPASVDKANYNDAKIMASMQMLPYNSLASKDSGAERSLLNFKVSLDEIFSGDTEDMFYDYEEAETLVEGTEYEAKVEAVYTTGISDPMYYTFIYHACDYYNDAEDFTATRVEGTLDIMLEWTNDDSDVDVDEFVGTNVYRDGEMIAFVEAGTETYTDEDLASGTYNYCVTQVYESDAESCEVCDEETMTAGGYVNGFVTEFATGDPIEGATVSMLGATDEFAFTTDEDGYYEGEVVEGTYDYTVYATDYRPEYLMDVFIDFGATVVNDFELKEFPFPVGDVVAWELDDNAVQVTWGGQVPPGASEWLVYDTDALVFDGIGAEAADYSLIWGSKWTPAQLIDYETGYVTKVSVYQSQPIVDYVTEVRIMSGDGMNVLYSQDITGTTVTGEWNMIELDEAVEFDNTENLWIGMYVERPGGTVNEPTALAIEVISDRYDYFAYNGAAWTSISGAYGIDDNAWMLRGYVTTDPNGKSVALGQGNYTDQHKDYSQMPSIPSGIGMVAATATNMNKFPQYAEESSRELVGYNVYRGPCDGEAEDFEFQGFTLDQQFTDNTWGVAEPGIYKWAVEVVYEYDNFSQYAYSNCLDKDMTTTVTVEVSTNSGDSPEGTDVMFTNVSEPTDPALVYEVELDASGIYTWDEFRKGTYDIYVHLNGFADVMLVDVYIWEAEYFEFILEELLAPPADLYVTPTGYATWGLGGVVPFEPFLETFNEGLPDTWTIIDGGTGTATWFWTESDGGNTLDGTPFMFVDSDGNSGQTLEETLISPVIPNTENADALFLEWDQNFQWVSGADYGSVQVFDGSDWVEVLFLQADDPTYPTLVHHSIDVTEYANADFQVKFYYNDMGAWAWQWAVDNIAVTEGDSKYADRALEYYKVWHDYTFVTDRDTTFYQYGDNGEVLVPGETYMAEVAAVYSTGISPKMMYEWIYLPCDSFPGPERLMAENVPDTKDVLITWSDIGFTPYSFNFDEGIPEGWTIEDGGTTDDTWFWTESDAGNTLDGTPFMMVDSDAAGSGSQSDELLISPIFDYTEAADALYIEFDQYYNNLSTTEWADVDVWDGTEWVTVLHQTTDAGSWTSPDHQMIDVTAYANPDFKVRFHYYAPGWYWYWAIDNFELNTGEEKSRALEVIGTNVYRDGEMITFVAVPDTMYLDEDLQPGYYDYCVANVYTDDEGDHTWTSCPDGLCVIDVLVPEDCDAPQGLTAELDEENYYMIHLLWDQGTGIAEWLYYDDGTNVDGIGGPAIFHWAIKFDPAQLTPYDGTSVTKISLYCRTVPVNTLQIFEGTGAATLIHEQDLVGLTVEAWNEVELDSPVLIDVSKELWITVYTEDGANYPAGCGPTQNEPNGDLISQDGGATWDHLADFSLPYTWNLRCYVEDAKGAEKPLALENDKVYNTTSATVAASGVVNTSEGAVWTMTDNSSREWLGYNVYRNGELLLEEYPDNFYDDEAVEAGTIYCYEVTSVYSICGESDPTEEACVGNVGVIDLEATEANLYPNPARDQITIEAADMTRLHIVNYVGQVVYDQEFDSSSSRLLHTQNYQSGVYVARIYTEKGVITKRFVINR